MNTLAFKNIILVIIIYFIVSIIVQNWQDPVEYNTYTQYINSFVHYMLLGYVSSKLWSIVLLVTITYSIKEIIQTPSVLFDNVGKIITVKFIGLIAGILLQFFVPLKVDLLSVIIDK